MPANTPDMISAATKTVLLIDITRLSLDLRGDRPHLPDVPGRCRSPCLLRTAFTDCCPAVSRDGATGDRYTQSHRHLFTLHGSPSSP